MCVVLLIALLSACVSTVDGAPAETTGPTTTAQSATTTTRAREISTTSEPAVASEAISVDIRTRPDGSTQIGVVRIPSDPTGAPLVVLFHGAATSVDSVASLADALVGSGIAVLASETLIASAVGPSSIPRVFPTAIDDGVCAIAFALDHASGWGVVADRLVVVGHAAGGNVGAFAALEPVSSDGSCASPPDAVAGYVGLSTNPAATSEIGNDFRYVEGDAALEELLDIRRLLGRNPGLALAVLTLVDDALAPIEGIRAFVELVGDAGYDVELVELRGTGHSVLTKPTTTHGMTALEAILEMVASTRR